MKPAQNHLAKSTNKWIFFTLLPVTTALLLTGCWTPPNANVQPKGEQRLIQSGVPVESTRDRLTVQSVDAGRILKLESSDGHMITCTVDPQVENFGEVKAGDKIKVTLVEELAVYVLKDGMLPAAGGTDEVIPVIAKVQLVDPSYRLLTLQYPDGKVAVFKAGLSARLLEMQPGNSVVLQSAAVKKISIEK